MDFSDWLLPPDFVSFEDLSHCVCLNQLIRGLDNMEKKKSNKNIKKGF